MTTLFSIAQVSLETGIAKEVLRKWEARYGFPVPLRDGNGNRSYTEEQVSRLRRIRKLLDDGHRPAQVVPLDEAGLAALDAAARPVQAAASEAGAGSDVLEWLRMRDPSLLRQKLRQELTLKGLAGFVRDVMPVMNVQVGAAWQQGSIAVRDEHLYSEIVQTLLREALATLANAQGVPRILLTTLPGEPHVLGLLMLEVLMLLEGSHCISLGAQSPLAEIASAASDFQAEIVALSFSASFPRKKIAPLLRELRAQLPAQVSLWAGGAGTRDMDRTPRGVTLLGSLEEAITLVKRSRQLRRDAVS